MLKYFMMSNLHLHDVNPRECGTEDCPAGMNIGPTARDYYLIHYVFSGKGVFETGEKEYNVSKGQIFIFHPHEVVYYKSDDNDPWEYCWVGFECNIALPEMLNESVISLPSAEHIFTGLKNCEKNPEKEYYICAKIFELLSLLTPSPTGLKNKSYQNIAKAKEYIDANYVSPITVEALADYLGINRSYFSTSFKKVVGRSPQQYIVDVRLTKAAELITLHGYSASAAAISTGYTDVFNFSKMFKRKYGLSPTAYAKENRSKSGEENK